MRRWIVGLMLMAMLALLPYGVTFSKSLTLNPNITVEVPADMADFTHWPGVRQQAQLGPHLGVVMVNAFSPSDNKYHYITVVFAHLTPNGEVTQHVLAAVIEMQEDKEVGFLVDKSYVSGGPATSKLERVQTRPNFDTVISANNKPHTKVGI